MQSAKGKPPTRGGLQILKENAETTRTYTYVAIGTTGFRWLANVLFAVAFDVTKIFDLSFLSVISDYVIPSLLILLCFIMKKISRPLYSDGTRKKLISPGYDLNMDYGLGEHLKDVILVLVVTYLLTLIHNLFFFTLVLLPIRLFYFLYVYVVEPYLALNPEGEPRRSNHMLHAICVMIVLGYIFAFLYPNLYPFFN